MLPTPLRSRATLGVAAALATLSLSALPGGAADAATAPDAAAPPAVATWSTAPVDMASGYVDKTVRNIVHTSVAGDDVQIRLSNAFGTVPVTFDAVWVGEQGAGAAVVEGTHQQATFGGQSSITVPVGAAVVTDPLDLSVEAGQNLAVSIHVDGDTGRVTGHWQAQQSGWYADGNTAADPSAASYVNRVEWWFWVDAVLVRPRVETHVIATLGDSITEGYGSTTDANRRYPDRLAARLAEHEGYAVLNAGIGGNRVTVDGGSAGVSVLARFDRDVLAQPGVRSVIYLEGINDIGSGAVTSSAELIRVNQALIARAHAAGLGIFGGTLTPFAGAGSYTPAREQIRTEVNEWIRTSGAFDGVVDFDAATRDPADPSRFLPAYDVGDHLHPNDAGYQAMADAVPLDELLEPVATAPTVSATTTTLDLGAPSVTSLGSTTATVTVAAQDGSVPSGAVSVQVDDAPLVTTLDENGRATMTLPRLATGRHQLIAVYDGGVEHAASFSRVANLRVTRAPTLTRGRLSARRVTRGHVVRLVVDVRAGGTAVTAGQVVVGIAGKGLARTVRAKIAGGRAVVALPRLARPGRYRVSYRFGGTSELDVSAPRTVVLRVTR